jgi:hypothetical protein
MKEEFYKKPDTLPVWVRAPVRGPEHYTGLSRGKLYELSSKKLIRSFALKDSGAARGCRLFHLQSVLDYIEGIERSQKETPVEDSGLELRGYRPAPDGYQPEPDIHDIEMVGSELWIKDKE